MDFLKQLNTKPNTLYTFDNYFSSQSEIMALKSEFENINPMIISGISGTGVTHLISAICNSFIKQNKKVLYITSQWLIHLNKKLSTKKNKQTFINSIINYDVLAIDNIQFFYRKAKHQSGFVIDIIKLFSNSNKVVLLGCSEPKKDFTKSKKLINELSLKRIELKQLNSYDVYKALKQLCSNEDNIPDNLIYAISGFNGTIQQHINCLISVRFNIKIQGITTENLSIEQFNQLLDLKKYFPKQQFRKCFNQTQLKFTKDLELKILQRPK